jgi:hypothetical protein
MLAVSHACTLAGKKGLWVKNKDKRIENQNIYLFIFADEL